MRVGPSRTHGIQNATIVIVSVAGLLAFSLPFVISALPNEPVESRRERSSRRYCWR